MVEVLRGIAGFLAASGMFVTVIMFVIVAIFIVGGVLSWILK